MFIFLLIFLAFYGTYFYLSYQVILLNDLQEIFSQTATKAQEDFRGYGERVLEDLGKSYWNISLVIVFATLLCFTWILLLKYNAEIIIWLSIFSLPILLSLGLYFSATTYLSLHDEGFDNEPPPPQPYWTNQQLGIQPRLLPQQDNQVQPQRQLPIAQQPSINNNTRLQVSQQAPPRRANKTRTAQVDQSLEYEKAIQNVLTAELMSYLRNETLWLVVSIILFIILFASIIILHTLKERVKLSIALIKQASKAINGVKSTLVFPILPRLFGIGVLIYGIFITLLIVSASHPQSVGQHQTPLNRKHVWKYHAVNLFSTLWLIHFISGVSQTTLAGAFASYYWAYKKPRDVPYFAVTASFCRCIRYHLGDIAFGSFLIATIRYIRIVIEFIDRRVRGKKTNTNAASATQSITCFFRVFFWLLDRFLKYIDRNAYIMMSMYGEGYLASAKRAVELLYKNTTRALVLDYVTYFVLLISRLLITGIAGYITAQEVFTAELHYKWLPVVLVVLSTYFISKGLFSVYSMAVDTLFICFLIDSTNNDGSLERPYFMSKELRKIVKQNTVMS